MQYGQPLTEDLELGVSTGVYKNLIRFAVFMYMLLFPVSACASPEKVALIIGNSAYAAEARLENAVNDAEMIAALFEELGFDTTLIRDLTTTDSAAHLNAYEDEAAAADVAVVYYAGHGMAVSGQNYLLPVNADVTSELSLIETAVPLSRLQNIVSGAARFGVVLFDACRTDPRSDDIILANGSEGVRQGLLREEAADGVVLGFAAQQGQVAYDGAGNNGPYAQALHTALRQNPNREIGRLLQNVTGLVREATGERQRPVFINGLSTLDDSDTFRFTGSVAVPSNPTSSIETGLPLTLTAGGGDEQVAEPALESPSVSFVTQCDQLAGFPRRPRVEGGSIPLSEMDPEAALRACKIDIFDYPEEPFLYFILSRAQAEIDNTDPAILEYVRRGWIADDGFALDLYARVAFDGLASVERNRDLAFQLALMAAQNGYPQSLITIGDRFRDNEPIDPARADFLYRAAQDFDLPEASAKIAWMMMNYGDEEPKYAEVRALYQVAADGEFAWAINNLGVMEQRGQGIPERSLSAAMERYEEACAMDYSLACENIAEILVVAPYGSPEDFKRAAQLYRQACDVGYEKSCFGLGWLHENDYIEGADREVARALYASACEEDHPGACNNLGNLINNDDDSSDISVIVKVYDLWTKACELGDRNGCYSLARRIRDFGAIVRPNVPQPQIDNDIRNLYSTACDKGKRSACNSLGNIYWTGDTEAEQDYNQAAVYYLKGCDLGHQWACLNRARLARYERIEISENPMALIRGLCDQGMSDGCRYLGIFMLEDAETASPVSQRTLQDAYDAINKACDMGEEDSCTEMIFADSSFGSEDAFDRRYGGRAERVLKAAEAHGDFFGFTESYWGISKADVANGSGFDFAFELQHALRDRGFYTGAIDGVIGPQTMRALERLGH